MQPHPWAPAEVKRGHCFSPASWLTLSVQIFSSLLPFSATRAVPLLQLSWQLRFLECWDLVNKQFLTYLKKKTKHTTNKKTQKNHLGAEIQVLEDRKETRNTPDGKFWFFKEVV